MSGIQRDYGPKGVQVLMSAMDDNAAGQVPLFVQQFKPNYPVGWTDRTAALGFLRVSVMTPGYVPKAAFIDRQGIVRFQVFGEDPYFSDAAREKNIRGTLDRILREQSKTQRTKGKRPPARK